MHLSVRAWKTALAVFALFAALVTGYEARHVVPLMWSNPAGDSESTPTS